MDAIVREGQRRYRNALSLAGGASTASWPAPLMESLDGVPPTLSAPDLTPVWGPYTTVGSVLEISPGLAELFLRFGELHCPGCGSLQGRARGASAESECEECGHALPALDANLLSFESTSGRCMECGGLGERVSISTEALVPDASLSLSTGAVAPWHEKNSAFYRGLLQSLCEGAGIDVDAPWAMLSKAAQDLVLHGKAESDFRGVVYDMERRLAQASEPSDAAGSTMEWLEPYLRAAACDSCGGSRLSSKARCLRLAGLSMAELHGIALRELPTTWRRLAESAGSHAQLAEELGVRTLERVREASELGLAHLPLGRACTKLSTGESQKLRLLALLSSGLSPVLYVLDEASAGMHLEDSQQLLALMKRSIERGDSLLVIDESQLLLESADTVIELPSAAHEEGAGLPVPKERGPAEEFLTLHGVNTNNLKAVDLEVPLGRMTSLVGVSGSGKSSLLWQCRQLQGERAIAEFVCVDSFDEESMPAAGLDLGVGLEARARQELLQEFGLGRLEIGQSLSHLSGGERQRLRLAMALGPRREGHCVYLIDQPSRSLHGRELGVVLQALMRLAEMGHTIILSDHSLGVIRLCDHLVELGPGPGDEGGVIIATGTPAELAQCDTATGRALR